MHWDYLVKLDANDYILKHFIEDISSINVR